MAYTITSESYGRRLPKITATADSTDDLATLGIDWAEGSSCVIGTKTYVLDKVSGWVESGSGGGSSDYFDVVFTYSDGEGEARDVVVCDKTYDEIAAAIMAGKYVRAKLMSADFTNGGAIDSLSLYCHLVGDEVDTIDFLTTPETSTHGVTQARCRWTSFDTSLDGLTLEWVGYPNN